MNDEVENMMVLPPLDESLKDKFMIFLATRPDCLPRDNDNDNASRKKFRSALTAELPAFVHFLSTWQPPRALRDSRFGVKAWQHPELLQAIEALSPEARLLALIEAGKLLEGTNGWIGSQEQLESAIREQAPGEAARLFTFSTACGVYLARLKNKYPARFEQKRPANKVIWTIKP